MSTRRAVIHFLDGTFLGLEWPKQAPKDFIKFMSQVENTIKSPQLCLQVDGNLMVIERSSIKMFELIPAPEELPPGIIRNARRVDLAEPAPQEA